eukprot:TRINITY_DN111423_c0_g1_i1.p2 TRINITY_DN111423_c0_g1~~TRINITY_DN111423_c0_g1_i1.p2  ORF type:complete len:159 (+),score=37.83 TRINITY_DN111423_c0_g1_i1:115-591(+)
MASALPLVGSLDEKLFSRNLEHAMWPSDHDDDDRSTVALSMADDSSALWSRQASSEFAMLDGSPAVSSSELQAKLRQLALRVRIARGLPIETDSSAEEEEDEDEAVERIALAVRSLATRRASASSFTSDAESDCDTEPVMRSMALTARRLALGGCAHP